MIAGLRGSVLQREDDAVLLDVHGIAFRVFATPMTVAHLAAQVGEVQVTTRMIVREDDVSLYGFLSAEEDRLFGLLISVSGVGPRVALALLSQFSASGLALAVVRGDERQLTQASGVGRKLAARIVLELRDRLKGTSDAPGTISGAVAEDEALLALLALGLPERQAVELLTGAEGSVEARVRQALARVGRARV
ncbi:MAG: Holliday junction branch migration protein RuvA [Thermaerobacter sp.]|nr:Holliday junction branch migration protein RuvA [Thermaerobacter sp.]